MALHITVRMEAQANKADEMEAVVIDLAEKSRKNDGALQYDFFRSGTSFMSYEVWRDQAALDAHCQRRL